AMSSGVARLLGGDPHVAATRAWVPIFSGHSASIAVETKEPLSAEAARAALDAADGLSLIDDPAEGEYPVNGDAVGGDAVQVGRLRADGDRRLLLWTAADNLRHGAALAAVRLAAEVLAR